MTYAEEKQARIAISKALAREYTRKSKSVQNPELQRIYANIAIACDGNDAAVNGAREALYELRNISDKLVQWAESSEKNVREWKKLDALRKKLQAFLNKREAMLNQFGIQAPLGM